MCAVLSTRASLLVSGSSLCAWITLVRAVVAYDGITFLRNETAFPDILVVQWYWQGPQWAGDIFCSIWGLLSPAWMAISWSDETLEKDEIPVLLHYDWRHLTLRRASAPSLKLKGPIITIFPLEMTILSEVGGTATGPRYTHLGMGPKFIDRWRIYPKPHQDRDFWRLRSMREPSCPGSQTPLQSHSCVLHILFSFLGWESQPAKNDRSLIAI